MRLITATAPRAAFYDRNPNGGFLQYGASAVAPHATTERATYTVPSGKKAFVELGQVYVFKATAAAPAGRIRLYWRWTESGGAATSVTEARIAAQQNAVADRDSNLFTGAMHINAGDVIDIQSVDDGTGGTVDYLATIKYTEFDA